MNEWLQTIVQLQTYFGSGRFISVGPINDGSFLWLFRLETLIQPGTASADHDESYIPRPYKVSINLVDWNCIPGLLCLELSLSTYSGWLSSSVGGIHEFAIWVVSATSCWSFTSAYPFSGNRISGHMETPGRKERVWWHSSSSLVWLNVAKISIDSLLFILYLDEDTIIAGVTCISIYNKVSLRVEISLLVRLLTNSV